MAIGQDTVIELLMQGLISRGAERTLFNTSGGIDMIERKMRVWLGKASRDFLWV
ncbi:MAG: hypothetical protein QF577_05545 [Phycisphaerae bacterium]|nr:hypothetical protein [Phycisphaerae bacterium]